MTIYLRHCHYIQYNWKLFFFLLFFLESQIMTVYYLLNNSHELFYTLSYSRTIPSNTIFRIIIILIIQ